MLCVETIGKIRRAHFRDGRSIKGISRDFRLSRETVRKVLRSGRERVPLTRIFEDLHALGYAGGYDAVPRSRQPASSRSKTKRVRISSISQLLFLLSLNSRA